MLSRRNWLRINLLAGLGLSFPLKSARSASQQGVSPGFGKARSVVLIYASGGQSQFETWDPKPDAPEEIRGELGSIGTPVAGLRVCELMPKLARLAPLYSVVRSVSHDDRDHGSATYLALTGHYHARKSGNPPVLPTDLPTYGSIVQELARERRLPRPLNFPFAAAHVNAPAIIPEILAPGQFAGLLGRRCEPLTIGDPLHDLGALSGLEELEDLDLSRLGRRRQLLDRLEVATRAMEKNGPISASAEAQRQAFDLLATSSIRQAFDLGREPERVREEYGRHRSGQACLLARRLVEAGVPWITVIWNHSNRGQDKMPDNTEAFGWDTHNDIFSVLRNHLMPRFDASLSALLADLERRGLLETTLVVCMGEFGRAPRVSKQDRFAGSLPGRDHWPDVYSIMLAGAGVARGGVYGSSDRRGAYPRENAVGPWDVAATMFHALGIPAESHFHDPTGRPYQVSAGKPILDLFT